MVLRDFAGQAHLEANGDAHISADKDANGTGGVYLEVGGATILLATSAQVWIPRDLAHAGVHVGFYGVAPAVRPAALVQTYSTADRTLGAYTPDAENTAYTGATDGEAKLADLNALRIAYENLRAFAEDLAQHHNALVDDLQRLGLEQ